MKSVSASRMRQIDQAAITRFGLPVLLLMEHAGRAVAEAARAMVGKKRGSILIFCGGGNNGGDGIAAARWLSHRGYEVTVAWMKNPAQWTGDLRRHFTMAKKSRARFIAWERLSEKGKNRLLAGSKLIIDALLGTGTRAPLREPYRQLIDRINRARKPVIAVDLPSGLDADTGRPLGIAVKARLTVTMGLPKKGLLTARAHRFTGRLLVADLGFPRSLTRP